MLPSRDAPLPHALALGLRPASTADDLLFAAMDDHDGDATTTSVGLVRLQVAHDERAHVQNDVILEMAIAHVTDKLYVYVDVSDPSTAVASTSELFNVTWDLACAAGKPQLDIAIHSPGTSAQRWDELFYLPDVGVVFGILPTVGAHEEPKWLSRGELLPVRYEPPHQQLRLLFDRGVTFVGENDESFGKHPVVTVNGTFDHLHNGHRKLLALAVNMCSERLVVGITASKELLNAKPFAELIEPLETRKHKLLTFVQAINRAIEVQLVEVVDPLGPAVASTDNWMLLFGSTTDVAQLRDVRERRRAQSDFSAQLTRLVRRTHRSSLSSRRIRERIAAQRNRLEGALP